MNTKYIVYITKGKALILLCVFCITEVCICI